uniref:single-stranded DNA cytosine deaminase n=1 Tax=Nannospalax galili TaxID=1026970 RepID=A0A8C6RKS4_NANGA
MQPHRVGPRAGMVPACLGCCRSRHCPLIRYLWTFYFHFKNLRFANGRNNTFLCYEVRRMECGLPVRLYRGVFKQVTPNLHAEECFLYWFHSIVLEVLSPREEYKIIWYLSWSPCFHCADQVAKFLATHCNVSLLIFSARLYCFWDEWVQENLRRLSQEGAQMAAMSFQEFRECLEKFVDNDGQPFRPWKKLYRNYRFQNAMLQKILSVSETNCIFSLFPSLLHRSTSLSENIFRFQFNNQQRIKKPHRSRRTYLCYQLQWFDGREPLRGYLQNKVAKHAEILLIDMMRSMELGQVQITCYITWSPCPTCAQELAAFKQDHPDLVLRIYASRLYFHWKRKFQKGLYNLWRAGVHVDVMGLSEFTDCWTNFVNQQKPFKAWDRLEGNSRSIGRRLSRIRESWGLQDVINSFGNLQLTPPLP